MSTPTYKGYRQGQELTGEQARDLVNMGWIFPSVLARRWGVSERTVYGGIKLGRYFHVRYGRSTLIPGDISSAGVLPGIT